MEWWAFCFAKRPPFFLALLNNFCYYKYMNIFKTFEIFLREPLSILRERFIQIAHVNSTLATQSGVSVEMLDKKTQITVINSDKMYNLLQTVMRKQELRRKKSTFDQQKNQVVIGQLCGRM